MDVPLLIPGVALRRMYAPHQHEEKLWLGLALHEAGHAVMSYRTIQQCGGLALNKDGGTCYSPLLGQSALDLPRHLQDGEAFWTASTLETCAGGVAERILKDEGGYRVSSGQCHSSDDARLVEELKQLKHHAPMPWGHGHVAFLVPLFRGLAESILSVPAVERGLWQLADRLSRRKTMKGGDAEDVLCADSELRAMPPLLLDEHEWRETWHGYVDTYLDAMAARMKGQTAALATEASLSRSRETLQKRWNTQGFQDKDASWGLVHKDADR